MQYKIPVQIENEDPIFLGLSLRQLFVIILGLGIAYLIFKSLEPKVGIQVAAIPSMIIGVISIVIAIFKQYEMTFVPFMLAILRFNVNSKERNWQKGVDSFQAIDIGFVTSIDTKKTDNIDFDKKIDKIKNLEDKIKRI